jgi:hypothetical protein
MVWAITLLAICEVSKEDAAAVCKRAERQAERKREREREGDILALAQKEVNTEISSASVDKQRATSFSKLWSTHSKWAAESLEDAVMYARENEPRSIDSQEEQKKEIARVFYGSLWDSLQGRGWKEVETENGKVFKFEDFKVRESEPTTVSNIKSLKADHLLV